MEQIKREFLRAASDSTNTNGKKRAKGVWQYAESGLLAIPETEEEGEGEDPLIRVLEGKTKYVCCWGFDKGRYLW